MEWEDKSLQKLESQTNENRTKRDGYVFETFFLKFSWL
jgi:hypothetical protein